MTSTLQSEAWGQNVLWLSIAALLNGIFVGQIGLLGWGTDVIRARAGLPGNKTPDLNPDRLGDYMQNGIWPFLVALIMQFILGIISIIPGFMFMGSILAMSGAGETASAMTALVGAPFLILAVVALSSFVVPFVLNAMISQDFSKAMDFGWAFHFLSIMFFEILWSGFVYYFLAVCVTLVGFLALCVGIFPAQGIIYGGTMNLLSQWYEIFLSRGGRPIALPKDVLVQAEVI